MDDWEEWVFWLTISILSSVGGFCMVYWMLQAWRVITYG